MTKSDLDAYSDLWENINEDTADKTATHVEEIHELRNQKSGWMGVGHGIAPSVCDSYTHY